MSTHGDCADAVRSRHRPGVGRVRPDLPAIMTRVPTRSRPPTGHRQRPRRRRRGRPPRFAPAHHRERGHAAGRSARRLQCACGSASSATWRRPSALGEFHQDERDRVRVSVLGRIVGIGRPPALRPAPADVQRGGAAPRLPLACVPLHQPRLRGHAGAYAGGLRRRPRPTPPDRSKPRAKCRLWAQGSGTSRPMTRRARSSPIP